MVMMSIVMQKSEPAKRAKILALTECSVDDPHRPAVWIIRVRGVAIHHGHCDFDRFESHTEEPDDPHPEQCSGTANRNRDSDAADVAETDGCGQRGRQGLKMVDRTRVAGIIKLASCHSNAVRQNRALGKFGPYREHDTR